MTDLKTVLSNLRRPRLLVRAARHGLSDYNRTRDLRRIAGPAANASSKRLLEHLVEQEEQIEETRQNGCATYSIARHIEVLVALMHECRLLRPDLRAS